MVEQNEEDERDWLDALDRAIQEVEALQAIYQDDEDDDDDSNKNDLLVKSLIEMDKARELVLGGEEILLPSPKEMIPTLELEMNVVCSENEQQEQPTTVSSARLYFGLPPGYPTYEPVKVTVLTADNLPGGRSAREKLTRHLQLKSREWIGSESIMELIQECQEQLLTLLQLAAKEQEQNQDQTTSSDAKQQQQLTGRRWIWVHHIKDKQRKDDIVQEANERNLGGYLKAGYPGIVVIEGWKDALDEYVMWIKGNKSRPGGFGRQWGHHVRGEINNIGQNNRQLPSTFIALEEDMSVLASLCRERGLEDEFLKFVMQHG